MGAQGIIGKNTEEGYKHRGREDGGRDGIVITRFIYTAAQGIITGFCGDCGAGALICMFMQLLTTRWKYSPDKEARPAQWLEILAVYVVISQIY